MNLKYIITGCPCSGTGYIAKSLHELGLKAGHEIYDYKREENEWVPRVGDSWGIPTDQVEIDVSYAHSHWLDVSTCPVIHLVRDPLKVINSFMAIQMRHPKRKTIDEMANELYRYNSLVEKCDRVFYLHHVEWPVMGLVDELQMGSRCIGIDSVVPKNYNSHNKGRCNFSWEDLSKHPWTHELREQYKTYGYEEQEEEV